MLLSVLVIAPVNASAPKEYDYSAFTILSPLQDGVYSVGRVDAKVRVNIFYNSSDRQNTVGLEYYKNGVLISKDILSYFEESMGKTLPKDGNTAGTYCSEAGKYEVKVYFRKGNGYTPSSYVGSYYFTVVKADNPVTVKTAAKSVKASALKKAKKTVKPMTIKKAEGTVKVVKVKSGTTGSIYKKITVNKNNGAITFKKGTYKKGTYKVNLKISAAGNKNYKSKTVTKTVKIKVK